MKGLLKTFRMETARPGKLTTLPQEGSRPFFSFQWGPNVRPFQIHPRVFLGSVWSNAFSHDKWISPEGKRENGVTERTARREREEKMSFAVSLLVIFPRFPTSMSLELGDKLTKARNEGFCPPFIAPAHSCLFAIVGTSELDDLVQEWKRTCFVQQPYS